MGRIFAASDLHLGVREKGNHAVAALARSLEGARPDDVLLLGGDLATTDARLSTCLQLFARFPGRKLAVAGNHDVWVGEGASSWDRYQRLPQLFAAEGFHALEEEPLVSDGVGYVGAMGWYDYSFRDEGLGIPDEAYRTKVYPGQPGPMWADAQNVRWTSTDAEMTGFQLDRLDRHLAGLAAVERVVVLMHHVPDFRLLPHPRFLVPKFWRFANAFLGSVRFGELFARHPKVKLVVSGHIHRPGFLEDHGRAFVSVGGDYERKELVTVDGGRVTRTSFGG